MTERTGVGRGRVWRSVAGVAVSASLSVAGGQMVRAEEPIVDTAAPPVATAPGADTAAPPVVVESSAPATPTVDEPVVAVGLPPVPPTTVVVAVGPPPVPPTYGASSPAPTPDAGVDASEIGSAVAGALADAALAGWLDAA